MLYVRISDLDKFRHRGVLVSNGPNLNWFRAIPCYSHHSRQGRGSDWTDPNTYLEEKNRIRIRPKHNASDSDPTWKTVLIFFYSTINVFTLYFCDRRYLQESLFSRSFDPVGIMIRIRHLLKTGSISDFRKTSRSQIRPHEPWLCYCNIRINIIEKLLLDYNFGQ